MAKIIDIFTKNSLKPGYKNYQDRFEICLQNEEKRGRCGCNICAEKRKLAAKLLTDSRKHLAEFMRKEGERVYYSDLFHVFIIAAKTLNKYLNKD
jgi:hypothetical protein